MLKAFRKYLSVVSNTLRTTNWLQWVVLAICAIIISYAFQMTRSAIELRNNSAFERITEHNLDALRVRLQKYSHSLDGGAGLLAASGNVSLVDWHNYVETLDIENELPGIRGMGLIEAVPLGEENRFLETARSDGVVNLQIHPETLVGESFIVKYFEPLLDNEEVVGFDIATEGDRRLAATRARDSGLTTMTQHIELTQDNSHHPGFLLLRPYYIVGMPVDTVEQRQSALKGWVYAAFIGENLLENLTTDQGTRFHVSVFDGYIADNSSLIYNSHHDVDTGGNYKYSKTASVDYFGRTWTVIWHSTPEFETAYQSRTALLVLIIGILISVVFWLIIRTQTRREETVRRLVEKKTLELAETEERWDTALKGAEIGVFDIDLIKGVSVVSDTWKRLMNVPVDGPPMDTQQEFLKKIHPEDLLLVQAADQACMDRKTDRSVVEYRMQINPGVWRWMKSDAVVVGRNEDGEALRLVGSQTDVTSLYEAREALRSSREQFKALFSNAPVGMALVDENAALTGANDALRSFLGYSEDELISKKYWDFMVPSESRKIVGIIELLRNGDLSTYQSEHQFVRKDGQIIWGLANVSLDQDPMTRRDLYITQIQNIHKIKELEKVKSEFVATVSHELRTPLTSVKGALGLLQGTMKDQLSETSARLLDIANTNCSRLALLVNDILDMEKLSSGKLEIIHMNENLKDLIQNSIEHMMPYAKEHESRIKCNTLPDDLNVWVEGKRVEQVLANLLSNAVKFSFPGGDIHVSFKRDGKFARISVLNSGMGIPKKLETKIFKPFSQLDSSSTRKKNGTGLGLYITKNIVEQMGGNIGFESIEGLHTTFWFTLRLSDCQMKPDRPPLTGPC